MLSGLIRQDTRGTAATTRCPPVIQIPALTRTIVISTISNPFLQNPPHPANTSQHSLMPLIIPMSLHSLQNVGEAEGPTAPPTPMLVKDDMSFSELCDTLKIYCGLFVFPYRVLANTAPPLTRCYTTQLLRTSTHRKTSTLSNFPL